MTASPTLGEEKVCEEKGDGREEIAFLINKLLRETLEGQHK